MKNRGYVLLVGKAAQFASIMEGRFRFQTIEENQLHENNLQNIAIDLIILYAEQSGQSVLNVMTDLKNSVIIRDTPVFVLDASADFALECAVFKCGAADYLSVPFQDEVLLCRMLRHIDAHERWRGLEHEVLKKENEMNRLSLQTLTAVANLVDSKDRYLKGHSIRVAEYARAIVHKLHRTKQEQKDIYYMGMLHDIGKISIPDSIFMKAGRLTDLEYALVKQHTLVGQELLKDITMIPHVSEIARCHHERCDGTGYTEGLKDDEIPFEAKIINIADAFDAMSTDRAYRNRLSDEEIRQELENERGKQFDSRLVDIVLELMDENFDPDRNRIMENIGSSSLAEEGNVLLQRLFMDYTQEIKDISHRDPLTGLWNRWYLESQINSFLRTKRHSGSFFMLDLDNFKTVNDNYGHLAGDRLLIQFGAILESFSREEDITCRFGGDEFAIFFKELNKIEVLQQKAELFIQVLREKLLAPQGYTEVSLSIGIAIAPTHGFSFAELYQKADKALYYVKHHGKNGYRFYELEESEE